MKEIQQERVRQLNEKDVKDGDYVLYWMQEAQRTEYNYALEYAVQRANDIGKRLLVLFGLTADYPEANLRHYVFMLEGLREVEEDLQRRGIKFVVKLGSPDEVALEYGKHASTIVCDMGYMRPQKGWREKVASESDCLVAQVETEVVVPVELASDKREHAARTLRPKIRRHLDDFLSELEPTEIEQPSLDMEAEGLDLADIDAILDGMELDRSVSPVTHLYRGGTSEAKAILDRFIETRFETYVEHRNQPQTDDVSHMSKYLHYGHISPVYVALKIRGSGGPQDDVDSYLEEVIVRRELSMNFCHYTPDYDSYSNLPDWAQETLEEHQSDERIRLLPRTARERRDARRVLERGDEGDGPHRLHAQLHAHVLGKKILEWSDTQEPPTDHALPQQQVLLDGRDPNSFANVAWVFGQHDRGWTEREVYGKVRYMSSAAWSARPSPRSTSRRWSAWSRGPGRGPA
jgi:deoxyribodipyrimidine photo-lyase